MLMTKMYFAEQPDAAHDVHELHVNLLGQKMVFMTDAGVFSKKMVDFGSQVLLESLAFEDGQTLLDVGCGYGPLGLTLAKAQHVYPTLIDINQRAIDLALQNAEKNKVQANIFQSNLYEKVEGVFNHIISNPPIRAGKRVVHTIIEESPMYLENGGTFTIVIQKKQGAPSAKAKMAEIYGNVEIIRKEKGYYILQSIKDARS